LATRPTPVCLGADRDRRAFLADALALGEIIHTCPVRGDVTAD
jgi:hypothetical protein